MFNQNHHLKAIKLLALGVVILAFAGCTRYCYFGSPFAPTYPNINRLMFSPYNVQYKEFPVPYYPSGLYQRAAGLLDDPELDFEILGEGYGQSVGHAVLLGGFLYHREPTIWEAYNQAIRSLGGDILIETHSEFVTSSFLSPLIYTRGVYKIWGLVAKVSKKKE
ncbi:MAG: hypothetical protein ABIK93_02390 [candidate division WOR-3 bacterium]